MTWFFARYLYLCCILYRVGKDISDLPVNAIPAVVHQFLPKDYISAVDPVSMRGYGDKTICLAGVDHASDNNITNMSWLLL